MYVNIYMFKYESVCIHSYKLPICSLFLFYACKLRCYEFFIKVDFCICIAYHAVDVNKLFYRIRYPLD